MIQRIRETRENEDQNKPKQNKKINQAKEQEKKKKNQATEQYSTVDGSAAGDQLAPEIRKSLMWIVNKEHYNDNKWRWI